jgi:hypothetical protein
MREYLHIDGVVGGIHRREITVEYGERVLIVVQHSGGIVEMYEVLSEFGYAMPVDVPVQPCVQIPGYISTTYIDENGAKKSIVEPVISEREREEITDLVHNAPYKMCGHVNFI